MVVAAIMMSAGMARAAICGGVDFPLVEPIVAGFATMNGSFRNDPEQPTPPEKASRPFSIDRRGFVVSEGAAAIVLASRDFARAHGLPFQVELAGWSMTSDAHHYVAPNLPTVARCISRAIEQAGLKPGDIGAINAHAASTKAGDLVEARALKEIFGPQIPPTSANKSQLGHTMGAASAIETIFGIKGMLDNVILPTINHSPDPEIDLFCLTDRETEHHHQVLLKNAFGFGGTNCCLVIKRVF
jgi:3-oxoacyl-[acyl-carrier-protein] synthase II